MNTLKKVALLCAVFFASICALAQTTVSGSKVLDNNGNLLATGQWCFNATCATVTTGAFSESVTAGTQTVTVTNGGATTYLTVPGVVISGSTFSWDSYIVGASASISGMGTPRLACQVGAQFTQTDSVPVNQLWGCQNNGAGQAVWVKNPTPPFPTNVANVVASEYAAPIGSTVTCTNLFNSCTVLLSQNVTGWTIPNGLGGQNATVTFCENGTGGYTVSGTPSNVGNWPGLTSTSANACTSIHLTWNTSQGQWLAPPVGGSGSFSPGGDLGGSSTSQTVVGFRGVPLTSGTPTNGQSWIYNSGSNSYQLGTPTASAGGTSGQIQINSSGALAGATVPQLGTAIADSNNNYLLSTGAPAGGFPLPSGFADNQFWGTLAGSQFGAAGYGTATQGAIGIGFTALEHAKTCNACVGVGEGALATYVGEGTGNEDGNMVAVGPYACNQDSGSSSTGGFEVVCIGNKAYGFGTGENSSVFVGTHIYAPTLGSGNVFMGGNNTEYLYLDGGMVTSTSGTFVGASIFSNPGMTGVTSTTYTTANESVFGANAATCWFNTGPNTLIGAGVAAGSNCTTPVTATKNVIITAGGTGSGGVGVSITSAMGNVLIGGNDGSGNSTAQAATSLSKSTIVGLGAGASLTNQTEASLYGDHSGATATVAVDAFGAFACSSVTGASDACFGALSGQNITSGTRDVFVAPSSGSAVTTGSSDNFYGVGSGGGVVAASDDSFYGDNSGRRGVDDAGLNTCMGYACLFTLSGATGSETKNSFFGANTQSYGTINFGLGYAAVVGDSSHTSVTNAGELGQGTNNVSNTLQAWTINFLDNAGNATFKTIGVTSVPTIASASTIAPTSSVVTVSGTTTISTITPPTVLEGGAAFYGCIQFIPTGAWATTTGGNILNAVTATVDSPITGCYNGTNWNMNAGGGGSNAATVTTTATTTNATYYIPFISGDTTGNYGLNVTTGPTFNPSTSLLTIANLTVTGTCTGCSSGSALTLQTNGTNNASQTTLNMETSTANSVGLTVTPTYSSGGIEKWEITGSSYTGNAATSTTATNIAGGILGSLPYQSAANTTALLAGPTSGTVPYNLCSTPSGGVATAPAWCLAGVPGRTVATTSDTIAATDRGSVVLYNDASAVAVTFTSPATLTNNFDVAAVNENAGTVTFTLGAGDFFPGNTTTYALNEGDNCVFSSSDNTNAVARCSPGLLAQGTGITITPSATGKTISLPTVTIALGGTGATTDTAALSNLLGNPATGTYSINCTSSSSCTTTAATGSGTVSAAPQYDVAYYTQAGTTAQVGGAAISGFQYDSTSGAPAAATAANLGALANIAQYDLIVSAGTSSALAGIAPSATSGLPLVSQGSSANPAFSVLGIVGGGTGDNTFTANQPIIGNGTSALTQGFALGSGTGTAGHLACATGSNTQGNCTATPPGNVLGVFNASGTFLSVGIVSVVIDSTQNVTAGDILCNSSSTAGEAHDNGSTSCATGQWVGIVTTTASSVSTVTASLRLQ
jgi:hypothetical protein